MEPFLSLRHVSKTFHANRALNDISIDFMPGEVHCLAGQNGCGSRRSIKIISGVYRPDEGAAMMLGGESVAQTDASGLCRPWDPGDLSGICRCFPISACGRTLL